MNLAARSSSLRAALAVFLALYTSCFSGAAEIATPTSCVAPPSGLVSWWRAEGNGSDATGGNDAILLNGVGFAPSEVGQGFSFDGVDDRVIVSNTPSLNFGPGANFSIEAWIQPLPAVTDFGVQSIVDKRFTPDFTAAVGYTFALVDGKLACQLADAPLAGLDFSTFLSPGPDLRDGQFHHVAMVVERTATNGGKLYVDGQVVLTFDPTLQPGDLSTTEPLRIGNHADPALNSHFKGRIDEVAIYNRALSANEIAGIYSAGSAGKCSGTNPPAGAAAFLLNVNFGAHLNPGSLSAIKVGLAATGATTNDFWNFYSRDGNSAFDWLVNSALPNLKLADGTPTAAGLVVNNAPGCWSDGSSDAMYNSYIYPFDSGNATVTFTNLPAGQFDVYVYGPDGNYELAVGGVSQGVQHTLDPAPVNPPVWTQGVQYARFTNVNVSVGLPLVVTVRPGIYGYAVISGMQIVSSATTNVVVTTNCTPAPSGLVSWWKGESSTADAADGNTGTIIGTGTVTYGPGVVGQAFVFDGTHRDRVTMGNPPNLRLEDFTLEAWVKRSSPTVTSFDVLGADGSVAGDGAAIFGYGRGGYVFAIANDGRLILSRTDLDGLISVPLLTDTNWHHLAVTKSGANAVFYVDGAPQATPAYDHPSPYTFDDATCDCSAAAAIGSRGDGRGGTFFGMIDEPAVFNRTLAASEIQAIYNAGSAGKCPPPPLVTCVPAPSGLVSWWQAAGNANDSADSNHGVLQNGATLVAGMVGQAFSLDGVNDFVSVPDAPNLRFGPSSPMTVDMWVYRTSSNPIQHMLAKRSGCTGSSTEGTYQLALNMNNGTGLSFANPGGSCACSGQDLPLNTWTHLAGTFDGRRLRLFINGQLAATTTGSLGTANTAPLKIGDAGSCGADYGAGFGGLIDEVSIYNRALTTNEIQAIYNAGSAGKCPPPPLVTCVPTPSGLVSWWQAEGNAVDTSGSNSGQLTGNTTFAPGEVGQAFVFDGVDGFITVPASSSLNVGLGAGLTLETWIKPSAIDLERPIAEWNSVTGGNPYPYGVHFWISVPVGYGAGPGCLYANLVDTAGNFHWLTSAGGLIDTNSFQHVAVTYDQSSGLAVLLLNGAVVAQQNLGSFTPQTGYNLYLGSRPGGTAAAYRWAGLMDEVSLYSRALSQTEIQAIYNAGSAGKCVVSNPPPVLAPVITAQPTNVTVYVGSNATFRVTATSDAPLSYQWRFDGHDLPGKTSSVLSLTGVQFSNAGPYSVVVSNAGGPITSSYAVLTVNPLPDCTLPPASLVSWWRAESNTLDGVSINDLTYSGIQPASTRFTAGKIGMAFRIAVRSYFIAPAREELNIGPGEGLTIEGWARPDSLTGAQSLIEWNDSKGNIGAGLMINGGFLEGYLTDTNTLPIRRVVLRSQPGAITNAAWQHVALAFDKASGLASILLNGIPVAQTNVGAFRPQTQSPVYFGFRPSGTLAANYFVGGLDEMSVYNRALAQSEILAIVNADVVGKCLVAPTIVTQPRDQAIPLGEDVKFTVAVLGTKPLKYQWRFNGTNLAGATNSALVLEKLQTNRAGNYSVFVSNAFGTTISSNAALTLLPPPTCTDTPAGLISWWPADGNQFDAMGTNNIAIFTPPIYVTGKVDRAFSFNGGRIQVNNSASLNFGSNANFSIEMWIKTGASNSVNPNVPLFEKRTTPSLWSGYSLSLNQGRLTFAMGSLPLISGTTVSMFTSPGPDLRDAMFHHVAVSVNRTATNGGNLYVDGQLVLTFDPTPRNGSLVTSASLYIGAPATTISNSYFGGLIDEPAIYNRALTAEEILAIRQAGAAGKCKVKPSILVQPVSQTVTIGSNATFNVTAAGSPKLRYQWLFNSGVISGATNDSYTVVATVGGNYSVRVTNLFGSVVSSNALLTVNLVPTASPQAVSLNEDTPTLITLIGSDPDGDLLSYPIITPPAHGALSGMGSNVVYTPNPNYNGPDSFTFKVNDGLVDSAPATVNLTILPVNDPPVALSQSVTLNEDTTAAITLGAFDVEGDALTFAVGTPAHGTLTGTPPNLTYQPNTNHFGPDSFTFKVNDGQYDSSNATVSISVISANDAPVAKATVSPLAPFPGLTNLVVISPNNTNASVVLDGSLSTDVENDPLHYSWLDGTNVIASGVLTTNVLGVGTHAITLAVSDGMDIGMDTVTVEVITPAQSVGILISMVEEANLLRQNRRPLIATLKAGAASFERNKLHTGLNQLNAFQNKVRAQIAPLDPALADSLINAAQVIIDALSSP